MDTRQFGGIESMQTVGVEDRNEGSTRVIRSAALQSTLVIADPPHGMATKFRNAVLEIVNDTAVGFIGFAKTAFGAQKRFRTWAAEAEIVGQRDAIVARIDGLSAKVANELAEIAAERASEFDPPPLEPGDLAGALIDQEIRLWAGEQRGEGKPLPTAFSAAKRERLLLALARSPLPTSAEESAMKEYRDAQEKAKPAIVADLERRAQDAEWAQEVLTSMRSILDREGAIQAIRAKQAA